MMKRLLLAVASVAVFGIGGGTAYAATAHPAAGTAPRLYSEQMVMFDCPGQASQVKPTSYVTFCADGGDIYVKMHWISWSPQLASATSVLGVNNCTPNCASGHIKNYPVLNVLWGSAAVPGHPGELAYTHMTVIFTGAKPGGFSQTTTIKLYLP
jgi:hypothetical protein